MSNRMPSLDGIRAIAIVSVLLIHIAESRKSSLFMIPDGVSIFFVLSGFLITSLMINEWASRGSIDLRLFYSRRLVRITPPLWAYLLLIAGIVFMTKANFTYSSLAPAALYLRDYIDTAPSANSFLTEHTWSLAVEEQFYLLYPVAFFLVLRKWTRASMIKVTAVLALLAPIYRLVAGLVFHRHVNPFTFHTRTDALMIGCLLALCVGTRRFEKFWSTYSTYIWVPLSLLLVSTAIETSKSLGQNSAHYSAAFGLSLDPVCSSLIILWLVRNPASLAGRIVNSRLLVAIGVRSYSIYLYQTLLLHTGSPIAHGLTSSIWSRLLLCFVAGWVSYRFVEAPFVALRKRLSPIASPTTSVEI